MMNNKLFCRSLYISVKFAVSAVDKNNWYYPISEAIPSARKNCIMVDNNQIAVHASTRRAVDLFVVEAIVASAAITNICTAAPIAPPIRKKKSAACRTTKTHTQPGTFTGIYYSPVAQSLPS